MGENIHVGDHFEFPQPIDSDFISRVYSSLPEQVAVILDDEWGAGERQQDIPHLELSNTQEFVSALMGDAKDTDKTGFEQSISDVLTLSARVLIATRITIRKQQGLGDHVVVDVSKLASQMLQQNGIEQIADITMSMRGRICIPEFILKKPIDPEAVSPKLEKQKTFEDLVGTNVVVVGIGGGSDGCQAAQEALCLERAGKTVKGVIDVRRMKEWSPEKLAEFNTLVISQGGIRVSEYSWKITQEIVGADTYFGSGRFMTHVPAGGVGMYLVLDNVPEVDTADTLKATIDVIGSVDAVYAADTGGDSLYPAHASDDNGIAHTTPDQDLAVLQALGRLEKQMDTVYFGSTIIAAGIDSPADAEERLFTAHAQYILPSEADIQEILRLYESWEMTGGNPNRFGVTPFVWQCALNEKYGVQSLPIPEKNILDKANPWNPFRVVNEGMRGVYVMSLSDHLDAISA